MGFVFYLILFCACSFATISFLKTDPCFTTLFLFSSAFCLFQSISRSKKFFFEAKYKNLYLEAIGVAKKDYSYTPQAVQLGRNYYGLVLGNNQVAIEMAILNDLRSNGINV